MGSGAQVLLTLGLMASVEAGSTERKTEKVRSICFGKLSSKQGLLLLMSVIFFPHSMTIPDCSGRQTSDGGALQEKFLFGALLKFNGGRCRHTISCFWERVEQAKRYLLNKPKVKGDLFCMLVAVGDDPWSMYGAALNENRRTHDVFAAICRGSTETIAAKTIATVGTNMQTLAYKKNSLDIRELGGSMAPVWNDFFKDCTTILVRFRPCTYFAPSMFLMRNAQMYMSLAHLQPIFSL